MILLQKLDQILAGRDIFSSLHTGIVMQNMKSLKNRILMYIDSFFLCNFDFSSNRLFTPIETIRNVRRSPSYMNGL